MLFHCDNQTEHWLHPQRNRKINAPVAGIPCQCNTAVLPDGAQCARWRAIGAVHACSTVRSALPGRFATDVAANHAVPGRAKSSAGRIGLALEVFDAVRAVWPERKPLGMRVSATDWAEGGWTLDDSVELATRLRKRGCDYTTASSGGVTSEQKLKVHPGYQVPCPSRKFVTWFVGPSVPQCHAAIRS